MWKLLTNCSVIRLLLFTLRLGKEGEKITQLEKACAEHHLRKTQIKRENFRRREQPPTPAGGPALLHSFRVIKIKRSFSIEPPERDIWIKTVRRKQGATGVEEAAAEHRNKNLK